MLQFHIEQPSYMPETLTVRIDFSIPSICFCQNSFLISEKDVFAFQVSYAPTEVSLSDKTEFLFFIIQYLVNNPRPRGWP